MTSAEMFESGVGRGDVLHRGIVSECIDGRTDTTLLKKGIPYPTIGKIIHRTSDCARERNASRGTTNVDQTKSFPSTTILHLDWDTRKTSHGVLLQFISPLHLKLNTRILHPRRHISATVFLAPTALPLDTMARLAPPPPRPGLPASAAIVTASPRETTPPHVLPRRNTNHQQQPGNRHALDDDVEFTRSETTGWDAR